MLLLVVAITLADGLTTYDAVLKNELKVERRHQEGGPRRQIKTTLPRTAIVVDMICDYLGTAFIEELQSRNIETIGVFSEYTARGLGEKFGEMPPDDFRAPPPGTHVQGDLLCCLSESDAGIATAERIADEANATFRNAVSPIRRHKWLLHETLGRCGLACCQQQLIDDVKDLNKFFFDDDDDGEVVVKPPRGVGSDGVWICGTLEEARDAVKKVLEAVRYGSQEEKNSEVLIQKRLQGAEYAVDTVSRDGEHKVVAVWRYEKRRLAQDAPRVYYCSELVSEYPSTLIPYVQKALTAVDHRNGPTHTEVIDDIMQGPTIVEINARFHNQDFVPITSTCLGLTQLQAAAMAMDDDWASVPSTPPPFAGGGRLIHLVSQRGGELRRLNSALVDAISALPSVVKVCVYATEPGDIVHRTVDVTTDAGYVLLAGDDKSLVDNDYFHILDRQHNLFIFTEDE